MFPVIIFPVGRIKLRVFEIRVPDKMFGLKNEEVTAKWRKLLNKELHNFYFCKILLELLNHGR
jgi:hypothetical protein